MLIDWLSFSVKNSIKNRDFLRIAQNSNVSDYLNSYGRVYHSQSTNELRIDLASKDLSFQDEENIKNLIFLEELKIRRLDLAYDDRENNFLSMHEIWSHIKNRAYTGQFQNFQILNSVRHAKKRTYLGQTIYAGKRSSHSFVRIYDKAQESYNIKKSDLLSQLKKRFKDLKNCPHWIRVEIELKQQNANTIFHKIVSEEFNPKEYLLKLIDFKEIDFNQKRNHRKDTCHWWTDFLGTFEKSNLSLPIKYWSLETLEKWIDHQVTPSLYAIIENKGENYLLEKIEKAKERYIQSGKNKKIKHVNESHFVDISKRNNSLRKRHVRKLIKKIWDNYKWT